MMPDDDKSVPPHLNIGMTFVERLEEYEKISVDPAIDWVEINEKLVILKQTARAAVNDGISVEAMFWYGRNLIYGEYKFEKNIEEGIQLLERAARMGSTEAKIILADIHCGFMKAPEEYFKPTRGIAYYETLDNGYAHYRLAKCYFSGIGVTSDPKKGQIHVEKAVKKFDSPHAKLLWGEQLLQGELSEQKVKQAQDFFEIVLDESPDRFLREQASTLIKEYTRIFVDVQAAITKQKKEREALKISQKKDQKPADVNDSQKPEIFKEGFKKSDSMQKLEEPLGFIQFDQDVPAPDSTKNSPAPASLTKEDLNAFLNGFDDYIGFDPIKDKVRSLFYMALNAQRRKAAGIESQIKPSLHMVFLGNPGTGKTVVARMMANIFKKMGYLSRGHLVEVDRSKLVGPYIGQSEKAASEIFKRARGGLLFIDEAYELNQGFGWDFGDIVITLLLKEMEDNRGDLIVIMAGYPEKMEAFLDSNPGLRSRVGLIIDFPDYKNEQLLKIFEKYCMDAQYVLSDLALKKVMVLLETMKPGKKDRFGNARGIRNLFEETLRRQAQRAVENDIMDGEGLSLILPQDIPGEDKTSGGDGRITYLSRK